MVAFLSILLIVLAVVMLHRKNKPGMIICAALLPLLALSRVWLMPTGADRVEQFEQNSAEVLAAVFAKKVVARHPVRRITLLTLPDVQDMPGPYRENQLVQQYLTRALEKSGVVVQQLALPISGGAGERLEPVSSSASEEEPEVMPGPSSLEAMGMALSRIDTRRLNRMLNDLSESTDVVICTLPLPAGITARELLAREKGPALILMHVKVDHLQYALKSTVLDMYLSYRTDASWKSDYKWPKDREAAFNHRFVVATREHPNPLP